ncbi:MAG: alpha-glucuronidase family glycosyl hydrolase [Candidatus Sulfotelmatobacter sp.]
MICRIKIEACGLFLLLAFCFAAANAETGADAWLRYAPLVTEQANNYKSLPDVAVALGKSEILTGATTELVRGVHGMLGKALTLTTIAPSESAIVIGTVEQISTMFPDFRNISGLKGDGFWLTSQQIHGFKCIIIAGGSDRGVLYGIFALLRKIAQNAGLGSLNDLEQPSTPLRWVNEWDNLDGSVERGYAGRSIFFENGRVLTDLTRASEYARLLASVGINGCAINNVNADPRILSPEFLPELARIARAFRPWGVRLGVAIDVGMPKTIGALDTFDPLGPSVAEWWQKKFDEVYRFVPDFGGVVVKADSEGRVGPTTYGRTPADAANVIARALKPHRGVVFYRAFVYNHHLDWTNLKNDRAKAAYDIFHPLDGKFDDNVIIQIKYGPIDFQVREPVSPLFGGLENTNAGIEVQITQEYTGQQRHTCFLVPMWKQILDFDLRIDNRPTLVKDVVAGTRFHRPLGGYIGVANVGLDKNWLGNYLAMANLYGFGRLAWNPNLTAQAIIGEWTRLTFGNDRLVVETVSRIQLASWKAYESYTGPLGLQTLTNILGSHYGPAPESQERNGWGQWIRADDRGVGMDRTIATGTGFVGQYSPQVQKLYESATSTPDDLILFFHHLPYTFRLHSGKTAIQTVYDRHYEGARKAAEFVTQWRSLYGYIDQDRYRVVLAQLTYQAGHAIVWRDAINDWFHQLSGIPDAAGRVGNHPHRIEAESMQLQGYVPVNVTPWEDASGGKAVVCAAPAQSCTAKFRLTGAPGRYEIVIQYFDQNNGASKFRVFVGQRLVDEWLANASLPATGPNGDSSTRRTIHGIMLHPGEELRVEGFPDGEERAPLDYIELNPD